MLNSGGVVRVVPAMRAEPHPSSTTQGERKDGSWPAVDLVALDAIHEQPDRLVDYRQRDGRFATRFGLMERGRVAGEGHFSDGDAIRRISDHLSV